MEKSKIYKMVFTVNVNRENHLLENWTNKSIMFYLYETEGLLNVNRKPKKQEKKINRDRERNLAIRQIECSNCIANQMNKSSFFNPKNKKKYSLNNNTIIIIISLVYWLCIMPSDFLVLTFHFVFQHQTSSIMNEGNNEISFQNNNI